MIGGSSLLAALSKLVTGRIIHEFNRGMRLPVSIGSDLALWTMPGKSAAGVSGSTHLQQHHSRHTRAHLEGDVVGEDDLARPKLRLVRGAGVQLRQEEPRLRAGECSVSTAMKPAVLRFRAPATSVGLWKVTGVAKTGEVAVLRCFAESSSAVQDDCSGCKAAAGGLPPSGPDACCER